MSNKTQLDHVAPQPHLTLRLEHQQQYADLLARHLGAEPGMTDERAGDDLHAVAAVAECDCALRRRSSRSVRVHRESAHD